MSKFKCSCGNEIENVEEPDAIDLQWTKAFGCDKCIKMISEEQNEEEEKNE